MAKTKTKKSLSTLLVVVLLAAIAVGGMLAYLTDRDSEANVFTVGNVEIDLTEDFTQGSDLLPGVTVEKEAKITNTGKNDAWVWMTLAVPAALDDENTALGSANVLHWNMPGCFWNGYHNQDKYIQSGIANGYLPEGSTGVADEDSWINDNVAVKETIDGVEYNVYTFKYVGAIEPGETTNVGLSSVYLDAAVDVDTNGDWYKVVNGTATKINWNDSMGAPKVYVSAYAIQEEGFADVNEAYAAYQTQWGTNGSEYGAPASVVKVSSEDDIVAALNAANGEPVVLDAEGADIGTLDYVTFTDGVVVKNMTVSGNSNYGNGVNGTVTFVNCNFEATGSYSAHFDHGNGNNDKVVFVDCHLEGWNSFGGAVEGLSFENCTFGHNGKYGIVRVYQDATFTNCTFFEDLEGVDTNVTGTVVNFNNCNGISAEKIHNNGAKKGTWFIDGVDVSDEVTSW